VQAEQQPEEGLAPCRCHFVIPVCENEADHRRRIREDLEESGISLT
jgi:hypothetical protein